MSIFKDKNLKFNTYCNKINKSKEICEISIEKKHMEKMDDFKKMNKNLPKLKNKLKIINNDLDLFNDQKQIDLLKEKIESQKQKLLIRIENINNNNIVLTEQCDNNVQIIDNEIKMTPEENEINRIYEMIDETDKKQIICNSIYERNCYINLLKRQKKEIEENIYIIENETEELEYYDHSYDILYEYYKKDDKEDDNKINLQELFKNNKKQIIKKNEKNKYIEQYLQSINEHTKKKRNLKIHKCTICDIPKTLNLQAGQFECMKCGESEITYVDSDKPSYKDRGNEVKQNTYRRSNHCSELLNQKQGKESTEIDGKIFQSIVNELYVIGVTDLQTITSSTIKTVLKNIGLSSKAEHTVYIINKLNGIPPPTISRELEEKVKQMFSDAEEAWLIFKKKNRKNFMNTNYVFHKIFELLGEDDEATKYPYLAPDKLEEHDELWEDICDYLRWEFIESI